MKKVLGKMSGFIFAAFGIAVLALLMSLTYGALQKLFPGNFANQMWGLVMFDIAAMCWAIAFVFQSKSTGQYAAAGLGFIVAFVGTLGMVAAEVMLSGQDLANVDTDQIGKWMVYGFIIVTAIHAALVYAHHALAPDIHEQINVGVARGEIVTEAISQATKTLEQEKSQLAVTIHHDIVSQVKRDLGLYPIQDTPFDRRQNQLTTSAPGLLVPPDEFLRLEEKYPTAPRVDMPTQQSRPLSQTFRDWVKGLRKQPAPALAHPEHILGDRGNDPADYYEPGSEYALPCGHTGGESWNKTLKVHECNVCGAVRPEETQARMKDEPSYHPVDLTPKPAAPEAGTKPTPFQGQDDRSYDI
jgi:hypothetical protein